MHMVALDVLDELDHALITALRADGRAPVAELARELGVTQASRVSLESYVETEVAGYDVATSLLPLV